MKQNFKNYEKKKIREWHSFNRTKLTNKVSKCICLPAIAIASAFKWGKNHYSKTFVKECKYKIKEKRLKPSIQHDLESSSDDYSEEEKEDFNEISE